MVTAALAMGLAFLATAGPVTPGTTAPVPTAAPQQARSATAVDAGRAFTYQGMLKSAGAPLSATADLQCTLYDGATAGTSFGTQTVTTTVSNGLFTVTLNDASQFTSTAFDGRALWLEIAVRSPAGSGAYTTLSPRQALSAAPIAATLAPQARIQATYTGSYNAGLNLAAPANTFNPTALSVLAGPRTFTWLTDVPAGVLSDTESGYGVVGTTNTGTGLYGRTLNGSGTGTAGRFDGDVSVNGKLLVDRWQSTMAINSVGPLPLTSASFTTHGGHLMITYSGSGYSSVASTLIGMTVKLDGVTFIDNTGILANNASQHLAFVPKTWLMSGVAPGSHTIGLTPLNISTQTDSGDIFNVTVTELPW